MSDILRDLVELGEQATNERSHHYVKACVERAIAEITALRRQRDALVAAIEVIARQPPNPTPTGT